MPRFMNSFLKVQLNRKQYPDDIKITQQNTFCLRGMQTHSFALNENESKNLSWILDNRQNSNLIELIGIEIDC